MAALLEDIELFIATHGLTERRFGEEALNDKNFVPQLRSGRRVWPETAEKVRRFMVSYRPDAEQNAA